VELRRLTIADLDSYFENRLRALQDSPSAFLTTYAEEVARGNSWFSQILSTQGDHRVIFGAVEGGRVVGTLGLSKEERPKLAHKAVIWGMFVDGGKRGAGIGGQLLDMGIHHAREKMGVVGVFLSVESGNCAARSLYESRGFKTWGVEPKAMHLDGAFFDEDHMALIFNPV
jgi:RimJ/RimL family protein N-acetyltransferase